MTTDATALIEQIEIFLAEAVLAGPGRLTLWGHEGCVVGCIYTPSLRGWYTRRGFVSYGEGDVCCITCGMSWRIAWGFTADSRTAQEIIDIAREQLRASE